MLDGSISDIYSFASTAASFELLNALTIGSINTKTVKETIAVKITPNVKTLEITAVA